MKFDLTVFDEYPEIMNKEQMFRVCGIGKNTAQYLLETGLVPCTDTGKKTHRFLIAKSDVIAYVTDRERNPDKYKAPALWYTDGQSVEHPDLCKSLEQDELNDTRIRAYYEEKLRYYSSLLTPKNIMMFTGFSKTAVNNWIYGGKLRYLDCLAGNLIPKEYFLDFLCSEWFNKNNRKPDRTKKYITEISKSKTSIK